MEKEKAKASKVASMVESKAARTAKEESKAASMRKRARKVRMEKEKAKASKVASKVSKARAQVKVPVLRSFAMSVTSVGTMPRTVGMQCAKSISKPNHVQAAWPLQVFRQQQGPPCRKLHSLADH